MAIKKFESVKLGLFVTIIFILFSYGIYRLGNSKSFFGNSMELYCDFEDVKGLREGNNVRFNGIAVGTVSDIVFQDENVLRVTIDVDKSMTKYMKRNAVATINSDGLVGNMVINIKNPKQEGNSFVKDGDVIKGEGESGIDAVMNSLSGTNEKIIKIVDNLVEITQSMNGGEGVVSSLLDDPTLASNLKSSISSLNHTILKINNMASTFDAMMSKAKNGDSNLGYLLQDNSLSSEIESISNNLDSLTSSKVEPIIEDISSTSKELKSSAETINDMLVKMQDDKTIVHHLLYDTMIMQNLNESLIQINEGTLKFDETMGALQQQWLIKRLLRKSQKDEEK